MKIGPDMEWDAENYQATCGRVTEHGANLVGELRKYCCDRVLDVGCGTGKLTNDIAGFAGEAVGIDSSPAMVAKAGTTYPGVRFYVMDARSLIWENYFTAVFSNAVFHFIRDQDALLNSIYRALTKGGTLVCEFGAAGNLAGLLNAVESACARRGKPYELRFYYPGEDEYRRTLTSRGFTIDAAVTYDLDTKLNTGETCLRDWISQIFNLEMERFGALERASVLEEIEAVLRPSQWDGERWHLPNRRLRVVARK